MWNPPDQVSTKEMIGRRAFGKDKSVFANSEATKYKLNVFLDDRLADDLSFDRLGVRAADSEVVEFLTALGDEIGRKMNKQFRGWAQIKVEDLGKLEFKKTDAEGEEKPFHGELSREDFRNENAARALAFQLCELASRHSFLSR